MPSFPSQSRMNSATSDSFPVGIAPVLTDGMRTRACSSSTISCVRPSTCSSIVWSEGNGVLEFPGQDESTGPISNRQKCRSDEPSFATIPNGDEAAGLPRQVKVALVVVQRRRLASGP